MKWLALIALILALVGLTASVTQGGQGVWGWFRSFCEAAAVGALADWFAVTALFRHPMGLPIPHTALIPKSKDCIADNLATFVRDRFMSPDMLLQKLMVFNPAARLGAWLTQPENVQRFALSIRTLALEGLAFTDEAAVKRSVSDFVLSQARRWDVSVSAANVIELLTKDGRHHALLDAALERVGEYLNSAETRKLIATKMVNSVSRDYPKVVALVDGFYGIDKLGDSLATKVAQEVVEEVHAALSVPNHAVRIRYESSIRDFIDRLRSDQAFIDQVNRIKDGVVDNENVKVYVEGILSDLRNAVEADVQREDSSLMAKLNSGLLAIGHKISQDPDLVRAINDHVLSAAEKLVLELRDGITEHIASTVKSWDERDLVNQMELSVGRDLQFIRLNGTLVGGLIGVVLHGVMKLVA